MKKATFAAGCFWGVENKFSHLQGVEKTKVGYTGGHVSNPSYEQVCSDTTGHAEAVEIIYNPQSISYDQLLNFFWQIHDPTQKNRQGVDVGSQYRSVIFYHDEEQKKLAEKSKENLENLGKFKYPIVTNIEPAKDFYEAEEYHQCYLKKKGIE